LERLGTVAIVGVGLIGGSIGLALRSRGLADHILGVGRSQSRLDEACRLGAIDEATTDVTRAAERSDVVVVCTPVDRIADDVLLAAATGRTSLLITDAGSTKRELVERVERNERARQAFVGAHPIAGSERQGAAHARADLFIDRACVLTPTARTPTDLVRRARCFWSNLGCRVVEMTPVAHDRALALTSHLPHVAASALASTIPAELLPLAAGAYRDGTRVAAADGTLWTAILVENRHSVCESVAKLQDRLRQFQAAIQAGDEPALRRLWEEGRSRRLEFEAAGN
jgi:prephenate dehydrogenase